MIRAARRAMTTARAAMAARGTRKFFRNRQAVAALCIIAVYFLIGLWVVLGDILPGRWGVGLSLAQVETPISPVPLPGFYADPGRERRAEAARIVLDDVNRAVRGGDEELAAVGYGPYRVGVDADAARQIVREGRAAYRALEAFPDLNKAPEADAPLAEVEAAVAKLWKPLSGWDRFWHGASLFLGADRQGRSILYRAVYSIKVALQVGIVVAVIAVAIGTLLGAAAGYFGGWVDAVIVWLYSTLSSVPELIVLAVLVYAFTGTLFDSASNPWLALFPVWAAMCLEFWIGPCRVVRGEVMKIRQLEYVQAGRAMGFGHARLLLRHVIPNTAHLIFINLSLLFIAAVKFEVILSFLGLGVKVGPSWGRMIQESTQEVINGVYWQIGAATVFMFALVLAFNIVSDALQDAFDPRHVG